MCLLLNHRATFFLERLVAPVRPQIFFSHTIEKLGHTLEPCHKFLKTLHTIYPLVLNFDKCFFFSTYFKVYATRGG